jgi:hypothetical protein
MAYCSSHLYKLFNVTSCVQTGMRFPFTAISTSPAGLSGKNGETEHFEAADAKKRPDAVSATTSGRDVRGDGNQ